MTRYLVRALVGHFRQGRSLFLLSVLGVALGVGSVLSIQIINANAIAAFEGSARAISGEADLSLVSRSGALSEALLPRVLAQAGVQGAWPVYRIDVGLAGEDGATLELLGLDLVAPRTLPWRVRPPDASAPLAEPGWIAISSELAGRRGFGVGRHFEVTSGSSRVRLVIGALVDFRRVAPLASSRLAVMDIAQAQALFGARGQISQLDIEVVPGQAIPELADRLDRALGPAVRAVTPEQRRRGAQQLLSAFRLNLSALSAISLFVGAFLVCASTQASLARRQGELGLLRCLGATRTQVLALVLGEVALTSVLGVALGCGLGYAAARASVRDVSRTLDTLYLLERIETLVLPYWLLPLAIVVGLVGAAVGALGPALASSRGDPRALLDRQGRAPRAGRAPQVMAGLALVLLALAFASYRVLSPSWTRAGFVSAACVLLAVPALAPELVGRVAALCRPRSFGLAYGLRAVGLHRHRSAFAVAALGVAVSMLVGITVLVGSFRRTVGTWLEQTARADVYVAGKSWKRGSPAGLSPEVVAALATQPGVRHADRLRQLQAGSREQTILLNGADFSLTAELGGRFELLEGERAAALAQVAERGAVLISEPLARKAHMALGDDLPLAAPAGEIRLPIAGIYRDYSSEGGSAALDLATLARHFGPGPIHSVALYLEPGHDPERVVAQLAQRFAAASLEIRSNRGLRQRVLAVFDQTFAVTRLLQVMGLAIAACGVALTLLVLAQESAAELALYRALGATRPQIFRVYLGQGLGIAIGGLLLGSAGGIALAMVLIFAINPDTFGWSITWHWPWGPLLRDAATILLVTGAASVHPALEASRTPVVELGREAGA